MDQALADDGYAYTNKVGEEDKIVIRQRRVSFPYDDTYSPTPLPRLAAVFHNFSQTKGAFKFLNPSRPLWFLVQNTGETGRRRHLIELI
jgi:hypothetical protein